MNAVLLGRTADSPRSRGWTGTMALTIPQLAGFPALAGMDPTFSRGSAACKWIPRARGDGPQEMPILRRVVTDSPRSRGWTVYVVLDAARIIGFPALAGMDPARPRRPWAALGIPRARGDGP